ncbi:hypothetical protein [Candidatus Contendibacter odensensis]|uniref:HK97 gp10 family phage protein n=1 Tax=Candidatus Contendobacter odensis Run_B_J11 TaxID=1400861 RepID=A0A7U7G942_9GAMM|nr:hypothetical protein [Candidatus Contendobacter odensis]CDH43848.1 conserved hypothetical protein [Candidatus Contendobacter odensis Run_B_J11]
MSSGSFAVDVSAWVKKAGDKADAFCRQFCAEVSERVIERTPVDTGFARSQWQPGINGSSSASDDPFAAVHLAASQMKSGDTFTLMNHCKYIGRLEYGWSQQAPNGMVRVTLAEAPDIAQKLIAALKP